MDPLENFVEADEGNCYDRGKKGLVQDGTHEVVMGLR